MAARFVLLALPVAAAWYGWHWQAVELSVWGVLLRVVLFALAAGIAGKLVGMLAYRLTHIKVGAGP
jgi:hypothetical protein